MKILVKSLAIFLLVSGMVHASDVKDKKILFSCNDNNQNLLLYGGLEGNIKKIMIESNSDSIVNTSKWFLANQINGKILSESFSRGAQTIIQFNLNNNKYVFEDSIIARNINEVPSHDIVKTALIIAPDKQKIHLTCKEKNDGVKGSAWTFFEKADLFAEYEENTLNTTSKNLMTLKVKTSLYKEPSELSQSKMYLIAGDKVTLLDTKTDEVGQEWYYISYQGKKEIKMWVKAEAVK